MSDKLKETLREGLKNEFDGALNYIYLASKTGDFDLRRKMLIYANEEIKHALKLLNLLEKLEVVIGDISPELVKVDDLIDFMINYQAKEESAVFYYQVLSQLLDEPHEKEIFADIEKEEKEHYDYIKNFIKRINQDG